MVVMKIELDVICEKRAYGKLVMEFYFRFFYEFALLHFRLSKPKAKALSKTNGYSKPKSGKWMQ